MFRSSVATLAAETLPHVAALLATAAAAVILAGCGQKGGLTLPAAPAATPRSVDQPAPPPAEPAGSASAPVR